MALLGVQTFCFSHFFVEIVSTLVRILPYLLTLGSLDELVTQLYHNRILDTFLEFSHSASGMYCSLSLGWKKSAGVSTPYFRSLLDTFSIFSFQPFLTVALNLFSHVSPSLHIYWQVFKNDQLPIDSLLSTLPSISSQFRDLRADWVQDAAFANRTEQTSFF